MKTRKTLVLGASENPARYANMAIRRLLQHGHEVVAVGLKEGEVEGVPIHKGKTDFEDLDTVTLYLNARNQEQYYDYITSLHPRRVVFNPGTENPDLYKILREHHIQWEVACTLVLLSTGQY